MACAGWRSGTPYCSRLFSDSKFGWRVRQAATQSCEPAHSRRISADISADEQLWVRSADQRWELRSALPRRWSLEHQLPTWYPQQYILAATRADVQPAASSATRCVTLSGRGILRSRT